MAARLSRVEPIESLPRHEWQSFLADVFDWKQGEHVSAVGPTGSGKTTILEAILPFRQWVVVVGTKPKDDNLSRLQKQGYRRIKEWPPPALCQRVLLWPTFRGRRDLPTQRAVIQAALSDVFARGGWTVNADELAYLCEMLRLELDLKLIWQQGRSSGVTLVGATQRPAFVPLEMYSAATHVFFFRTNDKRDLDRIGGIGSTDPQLIRYYVANLAEHDALYLNTRTGFLCVTRVTP